MSELEFAKIILFKKYPFRMAVLILNELLGAVLVVVGIGAIMPLLGALIDADGTPPGKIGEFVTLIGLSEADSSFIMVFLLAVLFGRFILDAVRSYLAGSIGVHLNENLKKEINHKIARADWRYFINSENLGKYIQCMTVESSLARGAVNDLAAVLAYSVMVVIMLGAIVFFSFYTLLIVAAIGLVLFLLARTLMKKSREMGEARIQTMNDLNNLIIDNKNLIKLLKAEGMAEKRHTLTEYLIERHRFTEMKQLFYSVIVENYGNLVSIVVMGLFSLVYLQMNFGDGTSLIFNLILIQRTAAYFGNFQTKRRSMIQKIPSYTSCINVMKEIDRESASFSRGTKQPTLNHNISFNQVAYSYPDGTSALEDVTLTLPAKGVVALVGRSGSGKTTIVDLLLGLIQPQKGKIEIDGVDMQNIDRKAWQEMLSYVPQDAYLFGGSLRDNLTLGVPSETSDEVVWHTLEKAECTDFVKALPNGLKTYVKSGGGNFSGGERQRLSIVRAILRGARILIMDEPSSSLDKKAEKEIKKMVEGLGQEMLIVIVTHSLDFIQGINHIYVVDAGTCLWKGCYKEMKKNKALLSVFAQ